MEEYLYCGRHYIRLWKGQTCPVCHNEYWEGQRKKEEEGRQKEWKQREKEKKKWEKREKEKLQNLATNSTNNSLDISLFGASKKKNKPTKPLGKSTPTKPSLFSEYAGYLAFIITVGYLFFILEEGFLCSLIVGAGVGVFTEKVIEPAILIIIIFIIIGILSK